jgi:hypothetical protein
MMVHWPSYLYIYPSWTDILAYYTDRITDVTAERSRATTLQDPDNPGKLYNHGNQYLHYEDDWYIVSWRPEEYAFIYYKGNNDAWRGYGGATVYTRSASLPQEYIPEFQKAAKV